MTKKQIEKMLFEGTKENDLKKVAWALNLGADVNADNDGWTPLHFAARWNSLEVAQVLLANGAEVDAKDEDGETPLHWAARNDRLEVAQILLANGAEVDAKADNEQTPLHFAARCSSLELAQVLLANGAEVDAENRWGETPYDRANSQEMRDLLEK